MVYRNVGGVHATSYLYLNEVSNFELPKFIVNSLLYKNIYFDSSMHQKLATMFKICLLYSMLPPFG